MKTKTNIQFSIIVVLLHSLLMSCVPSEKAIQESIFETQTAQPTETKTPIPTLTPTNTATPTPTPIPLSEIDLKYIILVKGDLPQGYVVEPVERNTKGTVFEIIKGIDNFFLQRFSKEGDGFGTVSILLFDDLSERDKAYESIIKNEMDTLNYATKKSLSDIGEKGFVYYTKILGNLSFNSLIFVRCNAIVYMVKTMDGENTTVLRAYANKIDDRLIDILCP